MGKIGQEPAFPVDHHYEHDKGISKRFYAACSAMQGLLTSTRINPFLDHDGIVEISYILADELLKQEEL